MTSSPWLLADIHMSVVRVVNDDKALSILYFFFGGNLPGFYVHAQASIHTVAVATKAKWNAEMEQLTLLLVPKNNPKLLLKGEEKLVINFGQLKLNNSRSIQKHNGSQSCINAKTWKLMTNCIMMVLTFYNWPKLKRQLYFYIYYLL